jgi:hypothetical protein
MSDDRARELVRIANQLKTDRSLFESHWQDIADVMRPTAHPFTGNQTTEQPGAKRTQKIFDAVPPLALEKFAAVLEALLSPRNQIWAKLTVNDEALQEDIEVQRYLEAVNKVLFRARYRPASNLASQLSESYLNLGSYGTQALYIGDDVGRSIVYRSCGLHRVVVGEDQHGRINQVHRWYQYTGDQAVRAFVGPVGQSDPKARPEFSALPQVIRQAYEGKSSRKFDFLHSVMPRDTVETERRDFRGMAFASFDVYCDDNSTITEGGFRTMPYAVSRYTKNSEELYGRSPAMLVLPDVNMLNRMNKATVRRAERELDPPLMTMDDSLAPFNLTNGAMNYGTLNEQGEQLVKAFELAGKGPGLGLDLMDQKRDVVREAFLLDVYQTIIDNPRMNMLQIMEILKDRAALLAPIMGRQQSELFGPMTERELDILTQAGKLPPMPDALIEADGEVEIEYQSPLALAMRAETGASILRTWEAVTPLAQTSEGPEAMRVFNITESVLELARINGYPAKGLRTKEEIAALEEQDAENMQAQQMLAAAPVVTQSLESLAGAQAKAAQGGGNV